MRHVPLLLLACACGASDVPGPAEPAPELHLAVADLDARFTADGVTVRGLATVRMSLRAWGREGALVTAEAPDLSRDGERVILDREGIVEWWEARPDGLEQSFLVASPPLGDGPLVLDLGVTGGTVAVDGARAWLAGMRYDGLVAWDDAGQGLPAWMEASEHGIRIVVEDAGATGAVWVDPLLALGWTFEGVLVGGRLGRSVASAGDVNGDGYADVVVGESHYTGAVSVQGRALLFLGAPGGPAAAPAWVSLGGSSYSQQGWSVASAGDMNGDGYDDVIVGEPNFMNVQRSEGRASVFHGSAAGLGMASAWTFEPDMPFALFGRSVASAGDVDGDGYDDVVVGAPWFNDDQALEGRAYVFRGAAAGLSAAPSWTVDGDQTGALLGYSVASAGDVDGDGFDDILVAAGAYDGGEDNEGKVFLYRGSPAGPSLFADWSVESDQENAYLGGAQWAGAVASAGDVNADGYDDVILGAPWFSNGELKEGRAFLYLGSSAGLGSVATWTAEGDQPDASFGTAVAPAGDVNADGYADVLVGAMDYSNGEAAEGRAYLYLGSAAGLAPLPAWTAESDQANAGYGCSVAGAGDVNVDGYADIVVGAFQYSGAMVFQGKAWLYLGACDTVDTDGDTVGDACDACEGFDDSSDIDYDWAPDGCDKCAIDADYHDLDGDRVPDLCDNCPLIIGLDQHDEDQDGLGDLCDRCDGFDDALDADLDGVPDACDECAGFPDGFDQDADGAADGCDVCPDADDRLDADLDGFPDGCDTCADGDDALDADLDLVPDTCDLCAALDSPEEAAMDADLDGIPDACDACPDFDDAIDADRDLAPDACDRCPDADDALDGDVDGTPDGCDLCASGTDSDDADADAVPDACDLCPGVAGGFDLDGDGLAVCSGDCHDGDATVFTGAVEIADGVDQDCDGRVDDGTIWADDDGDGFTEAGGDCDDVDGDVRPGNVEICDGLDGDCDGVADDGTECSDDDGDSFTELAGDCADADPLVFPGAFELLDNRVDDDCDGVVDPGHWDADGDGYELGDCAPADPTVSPGMPEIQNGVDDDCDGLVDEGTRASDDDADGVSEDGGDCDDAAATTHPGASELENRVDDDCDGLVDEGTASFDDDGDGQAEIGGDCDDADAAVFGGALEVVNGVDDDCDGTVDEGTVDVDRDGWTVEQGDCDDRSGWASPEGLEVCDGIDNDCDGSVDDDCATTTPNVVQPPVAEGGCDHAPGGAAGWAAVLAAVVNFRRSRRRFAGT